MENDAIEYNIAEPAAALSDFVESIWMLKNTRPEEKEIILLPDGRFDIIFSYAKNEPFHATLKGLETKSGQAFIPGGTVMFAVSFKLLAIEYLLNFTVASAINDGHHLPTGFWGITKSDLSNFENFCQKITATMTSLVKPGIDNRKKELFDLIYATNGSMPVNELSERVFWSSRQINRYFNKQFGIPLKSYCNILRFRASLEQIKEGKFFPEQDFTDQNHFIKEIKKFSGVVPKELHKNQNGRFILFSTPTKK